MAVPIQLSSFPAVSVEDVVELQIRPDAPHSVTFELDSDPSVTWWKALELHDASDRIIHQVETQDSNHGPRTFTASAVELRGARLVLAKAKLFGIHTGMYELRNLDAQVGKLLHFSWLNDQDSHGAVAGFFRDIGGGVDLVFNAVADAVETVFNAIADAIADVIELIGNLFAGALEAIGGLLAGIPGIGSFLRGAFHWLATVVSAAFHFFAACVKAVFNFFAGIIGGLLRIVGGLLGGLLAWDSGILGHSVEQGGIDLLGAVVGAVVMIVGTFWSFVQAFLFMQLNARPLTKEEFAMLRKVYRGSMAYWNIRVVEGFAGLYGAFYPDRAFTLGSTIYLKSTAPENKDHVLVHECCHVWQYQHFGSRYVAEAIGAQLTSRPYDWQAGLAGGVTRWQDLNRESQAQFVEDGWWRYGERVTPPPAISGNGVFYADDPIGTDVEYIVPGAAMSFTSFAVETMAYIRGQTSFRASQIFSEG